MYSCRWRWVQGYGDMLVVIDKNGNQVDGYLTVEEFIKMALLRDGRMMVCRWYRRKKWRLRRIA